MTDTTALLKSFASRLPAGDVGVLQGMSTAGEDGEFAVQLLAALADEHVSVTPAEFRALTGLVEDTGEGHDDLRKLTVEGAADLDDGHDLGGSEAAH